MNQKYFPFYDGTGEKTQTLPVNFNPKDPVSLDPRDIISEWSEESLKSLYPSDIYNGLKIYDLATRTLHICRWCPSEGSFNGNSCIWDVLHSEGDDKHEWVSAFEYEPEDTVDDKIAKAEQLKWRYSMKFKNTYVSFADNENITDELNNIIINAISKNTEPNDNYISFTYTAIATKNKVIKPDFNYYTESAIDKCVDKKIVVICPSNNGQRGTDARYVESIKINDVSINTNVSTITLESYNSELQELVNYDFDLYISELSYDKESLESIISNNSLAISIKA